MIKAVLIFESGQNADCIFQSAFRPAKEGGNYHQGLWKYKQHQGHNGFEPVTANLKTETRSDFVQCLRSMCTVMTFLCHSYDVELSDRLCNKDCAKRKDLWTTVFVPIVWVV